MIHFHTQQTELNLDNNTEEFSSNCPSPTSLSLTEADVWEHTTQSWGGQSPDFMVLQFRYDTSAVVKFYDQFTVWESLQ